MWAVTSSGVDKFSNLQVATFSTREGLGTEEADAVLAARDGTVWIGGAESFDALRDGKVSSMQAGKGLPGNQVTSLLEDHEGQLWVGIDSTLTIYKNGRFHRINKPDGSRSASSWGWPKTLTTTSGLRPSGHLEHSFAFTT